MTILLTGGLGFIGSHTYVELIEKGYNDIVIIDNLSNSKLEQIEKLGTLTKTTIKIYISDMLNIENIEKVFREKFNKYF